jgi:DNA gyrase subunit A
MTLGQLVNLEEQRLGEEHRKLLEEIREHLRILSDEQNILQIIKDDLLEIRRKFGDARRTEISDEEVGPVDKEDLIAEEMMVVTLSHQGYIKRTPASEYRRQRRGGKGLTGAKADEEDPIAHVFAASTHDYLLVFTSKGKVHWIKVYDLPQLARDSRGRAIVNLLRLEEGERIADCRPVRDFTKPNQFLVVATRKGFVKKTPLKAYSRPKVGGIIAIGLRPDDEVVDVCVVEAGQELLLLTANGMTIRFPESDVRAMGRTAAGVRGIRLSSSDRVVSMVVADPQATLLTVCEHGYGKRTPFGYGGELEGEDAVGAAFRYRTQRRGGKGIRDIKTTPRNGKVIGGVRVTDDDEVIMITARGKLQRIRASDVRIVGRNTQGVRIMLMDEGDVLAAVVRVPPEESQEITESVSASAPQESS